MERSKALRESLRQQREEREQTENNLLLNLAMAVWQLCVMEPKKDQAFQQLTETNAIAFQLQEACQENETLQERLKQVMETLQRELQTKEEKWSIEQRARLSPMLPELPEGIVQNRGAASHAQALEDVAASVASGKKKSKASPRGTPRRSNGIGHCDWDTAVPRMEEMYGAPVRVLAGWCAMCPEKSALGFELSCANLGATTGSRVRLRCGIVLLLQGREELCPAFDGTAFANDPRCKEQRLTATMGDCHVLSGGFMSASQAAADNTSRSPDCVVHFDMDRNSFSVRFMAFPPTDDTRSYCKVHAIGPDGQHRALLLSLPEDPEEHERDERDEGDQEICEKRETETDEWRKLGSKESHAELSFKCSCFRRSIERGRLFGELKILQPDDFHHHFRDEPYLEHTVPHAAAAFCRVLVMPNLVPPVTTTEAALAYRERILLRLPKDIKNGDFVPLMTLYLTDKTSPEEITKAKASGHIYAVKLYPAGATTNSDFGVTDYERIMPALLKMEELGILLLVHGESTDQSVDIFDREPDFYEKVMPMMLGKTFRAVANFVEKAGPNVAATITAHHLCHNRNAIFKGGINPHYYCLPILKTEPDRKKLLQCAVDNPKFFLGTDSAPHTVGKKAGQRGGLVVWSEKPGRYQNTTPSVISLFALSGLEKKLDGNYDLHLRNLRFFIEETQFNVRQQKDIKRRGGYIEAGDMERIVNYMDED
eukprot:g11753.t1